MTARSPILCSALALVACVLPPRLAADPAGGPVTLLPPMLVREHRDGAHWRYAAVGGLEVLSRCDDGTTTAFVTAYLRRQAELDQLLPPALRRRQSVPLAIILITPAVERAMNEDLVRTMNAKARTESSGYVTPQASAWQVYRLVRTFPQLTLSDDESTGMVCTLDAAQRGPVAPGGEAAGFFAGLANDGTYRDLTFTLGRIGGLLGGRSPPLPSWFKSGFLAFYQEIAWSSWTDADQVRAGPVLWISPALTRQAERPPGAPDDPRIALLPLVRFFAGPLGGAAPLTADESRRWRAQSSLLFHWAYAQPARREALWRFADQSSRQAVTEDLIQRCFGEGSLRLEEELLAYLPRAVKSPLPLLDAAAIRVPPIPLRNAAYVEAARITGDMGRKEIAYVKDADPDSVPPYVNQVGSVLRGPAEEGERDPAQLAVLGLFDCDVDRTDEALPFLAEAAAAHVARPEVYLELAKIRYQAALARPTGAEGKLGPEQVADLVGLLREGRRYEPALPESTLLAAEIWSRAEAAPSPENLTLLREGAELFPDNVPLVTAVAGRYVQAGAGEEGFRIVDRALAVTEPDSGARRALAQVRAQLASP